MPFSSIAAWRTKAASGKGLQSIDRFQNQILSKRQPSSLHFLSVLQPIYPCPKLYMDIRDNLQRILQ